MSAPARVGRGGIIAAVLVAVVAVLLTGCSSPTPIASNVVPPPATVGERLSFVTLGGNETARGLEESVNLPWNQQVFAALPLSATFANVASRDAPVAAGLAEQLPQALAERPTLATVWFGFGDATARTSTDAFAADLTAIVTQLQAAGAKVVLIARTQPDQPGLARYNAVVAQVATATGATLVQVEGRDNLRNPVEHNSVASAVQAVL
jgi:hypothetical protein